MTWKAEFEKAVKSHEAIDMTYQPFEFKAAGDSVVGKLLDIQSTHFEATNSDVNKYILETDDGVVSVIAGAIGDSQLDGRVKPGDLMRFEFVEKKLLTGGRTANIFNIQCVPGKVDDGKEKNDKTEVN